MKIKTTRMVSVEIESSEKGICFNKSAAAKKLVAVRAGDKMCSVGIIRRGRNWGDYDGKYCAECPYFIDERFLYRREKKLLENLKRSVKMNPETLKEILGTR
jgi:hypothetical protein